MMTSDPHEPAAPELDLNYEKFIATPSDDKGEESYKLNLIANKLKQGHPPKMMQRVTPSMSQKEI